MMRPDDKDLINSAELRAMLGMTEPTFYRHMRMGPPRKRAAGCPQIDIRDIPFKFFGGHKWFSLSETRKIMELDKGEKYGI